MKSWWVVALSVVLTLFGSGIIYLASQPPRGNPIQLLPPPSPAPIKIHIDGEIMNPGVYALPKGSRVEDAVIASGGFTERADKSRLNLAERLEDGYYLYVPEMIIADPSINKEPANEKGITPSITATVAPNQYSQRININSADKSTLESLPGIGPVTAEKIIKYRSEFGPFSSIEEIQKVNGIGPAKFDDIKDQITVEDIP